MGHGFENENLDDISPDNTGADTGEREAAWVDKKQRLSRLATRMRLPKVPLEKVNADNTDIPAGYTYFGQIIAHDMVASNSRFPVQAHQSDVRNFRNSPLLLESIYGGGPLLTPQPYAMDKGPRRKKFRMGKTRKNPRDTHINGPERDIARVACPFVSGQIPVDDNAEPPRNLPTDVLIADARNDDNLILSHMTALFQFFHNSVVEAVEKELAANPPARGTTDTLVFHLARAVVVRTYRRIVRNGYLARILNRKVYEKFNADYEKFLTGKLAKMPESLASAALDFKDRKVPLEFSHAAFRFGHGMVRQAYSLNTDRLETPDGSGGAKVTKIIEFTSSRRASDMPLSCDWMVDGWWRFFDVFPSDENRKPNFSRLMTPSVAPSLVTSNLIETTDNLPGSLLYRDFIRAESVGVKSVDRLLKKFGLADDKKYPLAGKKPRAKAIREWIGQVPFSGFPNSKDADRIADDPPLLFYILLEAEMLEQGRRLGRLGSEIVAGVIYHALEQTGAIDKTGFDEQVESIERLVFDDLPPREMPELLKWLGVAENWSQCPQNNPEPLVS